ncbi:MAG: hypothetical protein KA791_09385 [Flavobacteriales bacterium]|nr:hypothetical protein [Flavobacteriales bacterium]
MNPHQVSILSIAGLLLIIGGGCQTSGTTVLPEAIDPEQVSNAVVLYRIMDQQTMLFDSVLLPSPMLDRFVRSWNTSEQAEMRKFAPSFTIMLQLKDSSRRSFRLNGNYAKEKDDRSFRLRDTSLIASLDSLRSFNEHWYGRYGTENGAILELYRNGRYHYFMNQCTYGYSSEGTWSNVGDTLRLIADPEPNSTAGPITSRFEWASFGEPFVRKGSILYFTVEGDLNYHYFFTKE